MTVQGEAKAAYLPQVTTPSALAGMSEAGGLTSLVYWNVRSHIENKLQGQGLTVCILYGFIQ